MDAVRLHPNVKSELSRFLEDTVRSIKRNGIDKSDLEVKTNELINLHYPKLRLTEKAELIRSVGECKKPTIILPQYLCLEVKRILLTKRKLPCIFIGEESYTNLDWTFSLNGLVPFHVAKRIQGAAQSGIWQWWMRLLGKTLESGLAEGPPEEAVTMKGNIVVIFVLWACSIALTSPSILIEIYVFRKESCACLVKLRGPRGLAEVGTAQIKVKSGSF